MAEQNPFLNIKTLASLRGYRIASIVKEILAKSS